MPKAFLSCVQALETSLDVVSSQAQKTETAVGHLAVKLHRAGCAVTSVVEHMHEGNFHFSKYPDYLKGAIAEVRLLLTLTRATGAFIVLKGNCILKQVPRVTSCLISSGLVGSPQLQDIADVEQARENGQLALKVTAATGNTWSGKMGKPAEEILREVNDEVFRNMSESWDAELGFKLRAVPVKADALWVAKLEKETFKALKVRRPDGRGSCPPLATIISASGNRSTRLRSNKAATNRVRLDVLKKELISSRTWNNDFVL